MRRTIPQVNAEIVDFALLALAPDAAIMERFDLLARISKRPLFDAKLKFNALQVAREEKRLIVQLLLGKPGGEGKVVAQVCFTPPGVRA